jgi:ATP-dependent exoDNAse (exonuclease V) beta subunit
VTKTQLIDAAARSRIQNDLSSTLVVEAAAGTGKTTELVARIVALLRLGHTTLDRILCVTFTDLAAGEMKLRLRGELEKARLRAAAAGDPGSDAERGRLDDALAKLELAPIGTIHSFCADLLRERPVEARVDPVFEVAAGDQQERLFGGVFDAWFQRTVADPPEGVRRLLRRKVWSSDDPPRERLRDAGRDLCEHRDFDGPWRRDPLDRAAVLGAALEQLRAVAALSARAQRPEEWFAQSLAEIARFCEEQDRREGRHGERDLDALEADLHDLLRRRLWNWRGGGKWFAKDLEKQVALAQRDAAKAEVENALDRCDADLAACLREELRPLCAAYEEAKEQAGALDFLDLLSRARDLVRDDGEVRRELQERFTHVLVDEFQDTDPLQAEILLLLSADDPAEQDYRSSRPKAGKLFVVGDPKQSIYRFRRADIALYEDVKRILLRSGAELVHLSTSFRSVPAIQEAVNAGFAPRMQGGTQAAYVALDRNRPAIGGAGFAGDGRSANARSIGGGAGFAGDGRSANARSIGGGAGFAGDGRSANARSIGGQPAVIALPAPRIYGKNDKVALKQIEESYPHAVGAFVDWLLRESGFRVSERGKTEVPVEARHVCLLFKRMRGWDGDLTRGYVQALEARRIPHVLVGGRSYHAREEVLAVRNAAAAIEWPDDELSVFAALKGPFFAIADEELLLWRAERGALRPRALADLQGEVAEALRVLHELHRERNRRPIAETLSRLFDLTRAHAGLAIRPAGEQALGNVLRVLDLARKFESTGAVSFRAFVDRLAEDAERGESSEVPVIEEGTEGVRIMSVHKAKGLEFPVVILCDPCAPAAPKMPSRLVDPERRVWAMPLAGCAPQELREHEAELLQRDREEVVRVAYVAATRARDVLVVPVTGDEELQGWLEPLSSAVYPKPEERRMPRPVPGWTPSGKETVLDRPGGLFTVPVSPGLHAPVAGAHDVFWWDADPTRLDREVEAGIRSHDLLVEGGRSKETAEAHARWQVARAAAQAEGVRPSLRVETVTARSIAAAQAVDAIGAARVVDGARPVALEAAAGRERARPHGKRFGSLVHATLAEAALGATSEEIARIAAIQGRLAGAPDEEVRAAATAAEAALSHPLLRRAAKALEVRREEPLLHALPDGTLLEGVVDLAFREAQGWTVVDFKTDGVQPQYLEQIRLYCDAIEAATGQKAEAALLSV